MRALPRKWIQMHPGSGLRSTPPGGLINKVIVDEALGESGHLSLRGGTRGCSVQCDALSGALSRRGSEPRVGSLGLSEYRSHVGCNLAAASPRSELLCSGWLNNCQPAAVASRAPSHVRFTEPIEGALSLSLSLFLNGFTRLRVARRQRRETSGPSDLSSGGAAADAR